jgi:hypothetical protein
MLALRRLIGVMGMILSLMVFRVKNRLKWAMNLGLAHSKQLF